jgi:hypothetical protein
MSRSIDHVGRNVALLVILAGIALLCAVFAAAYQMLTHPVPGLLQALATPAGTPKNVQASPSWSAAAGAIVEFVLKLVVLFIMTLSGSLVAARGIHFYSAALTASHSREAADGVTSVPGSTSPGGPAHQ